MFGGMDIIQCSIFIYFLLTLDRLYYDNVQKGILLYGSEKLHKATGTNHMQERNY
jgi:hypothetical protein